MMKKIIAIAALTLGLLFVPAVAFAQHNVLDDICASEPGATACKENNTQTSRTNNPIYGPNGLLTKVASLIAVVVGMASVAMISIGGFKYVTSSGDPNNVKSAKDTILFAIVGLIIAVAAQSIVVFVLRKL